MNFFIAAFCLFSAFLILGIYWILRELKYIRATEGEMAAKKKARRFRRNIMLWLLFWAPMTLYFFFLYDKSFHQKPTYILGGFYMGLGIVVQTEGYVAYMFGKNGLYTQQRNKRNN